MISCPGGKKKSFKKSQKYLYHTVYNFFYMSCFVYVQRYGRLLGLCSDPVKGTIWAFTGQSIFKYKVTREARYVHVPMHWSLIGQEGKGGHSNPRVLIKNKLM